MGRPAVLEEVRIREGDALIERDLHVPSTMLDGVGPDEA